MNKVSALLAVLQMGAQAILTFGPDGKFKMVQFTDVHFGETDEDDANNQRLMGEILDQEKPDLVVITGDLISGYAWDGVTTPWSSVQWTKGVQPMVDRGINWATTAGNHDSQGDLTREQMSEFDRSFPLSLTLPNGGEISHAFNYVLYVYGHTSDVQFRLWFLDTGDDKCLDVPGYGCVMPDQIEWFRQQQLQVTDETKGKGFLFIHIPLDEFYQLYNDGNYVGSRDEPVCCPSVNTGLYSALIEQKTVEWVACGHDHDNDYYGSYANSGIKLAYGRKTGFGSYGPDKFARGARVFEVTLEPYSIETWIREDGGNVKVQTEPENQSMFFQPQRYCSATESMWVKRQRNSIIYECLTAIGGFTLSVVAIYYLCKWCKNRKLKKAQEAEARLTAVEDDDVQAAEKQE